MFRQQHHPGTGVAQICHGLRGARDHLLGKPHDTVAIEKPSHDRDPPRAGKPRVLRSAMARLEPFAAVRYDPARVDPDSVVSPPYDVVDPVERTRLAALSPYNAIHVELPARDESGGLDQYENAARIFHGWLDAASCGATCAMASTCTA